mmetsp:Transcript_14421/g.33451  ORF Transcript_14421/g.33451 Transcript_14421/m.33451 type:complete len:95 (+) Transcript_14421:2115-2399(+)
MEEVLPADPRGEVPTWEESGALPVHEEEILVPTVVPEVIGVPAVQTGTDLTTAETGVHHLRFREEGLLWTTTSVVPRLVTVTEGLGEIETGDNG